VTAYVVRRLGWTVIVLVVMSVLIFAAVRLLPGDPATILLGERASAELAAEIRTAMGLDEPWVSQYFDWIGGALHGDFGLSVAVFGTGGVSGTPVSEIVSSSVAVTLPLTALAMLWSILLGGLAGFLGALWQGGRKDYALSVGTFVGVSIPDFYLSILLILLLALTFPVLPATGWVSFGENPAQAFQHLLLPSLSLGIINAAAISRMLRASLLEVLQQDYIKAARSRGAPRSVVYLKHALRGALLPTLTVAGLQAGYLLGGAIIVEQVFALPGMGWSLLQAVSQRDYPTIQALVLMFALLFALVNLVTDLLYAVVDPRVRRQIGGRTAGVGAP
jgi:peptide/nickel transport system permease protein